MRRRTRTPDLPDAFAEFLAEEPGLWPERGKRRQTIDPYTEFNSEEIPDLAVRGPVTVTNSRHKLATASVVLALFAPAGLISTVIVGRGLTVSPSQIAETALPPLPPRLFGLRVEQQVVLPAPRDLPVVRPPAVESETGRAISRAARPAERPVLPSGSTLASIMPLTSALLSAPADDGGPPSGLPAASAPSPHPSDNAPVSAEAPPSAASSTERDDSLEKSAIRAVLDRYRHAFSNLDAGAARGVWPNVDEKTLQRAFSQLARQSVVFNSCNVDTSGTRAMASCSGRVEYVPKVGSRTPRDEDRHWNFALRRGERDWTIESVSVR